MSPCAQRVLGSLFSSHKCFWSLWKQPAANEPSCPIGHDIYSTIKKSQQNGKIPRFRRVRGGGELYTSDTVMQSKYGGDSEGVGPAALSHQADKLDSLSVHNCGPYVHSTAWRGRSSLPSWGVAPELLVWVWSPLELWRGLILSPPAMPVRRDPAAASSSLAASWGNFSSLLLGQNNSQVSSSCAG